MLYLVLKDGKWEYGPDNRCRVMTADGRDLTEQVCAELNHHLVTYCGVPGVDFDLLRMEDGWLVVDASESFHYSDFAESVTGDCPSFQGMEHLVVDEKGTDLWARDFGGDE